MATKNEGKTMLLLIKGSVIVKCDESDLDAISSLFDKGYRKLILIQKEEDDVLVSIGSNYEAKDFYEVLNEKSTFKKMKNVGASFSDAVNAEFRQ